MKQQMRQPRIKNVVKQLRDLNASVKGACAVALEYRGGWVVVAPRILWLAQGSVPGGRGAPFDALGMARRMIAEVCGEKKMVREQTGR